MAKKVSILSSAGLISGARLHRLANTLIRAGHEVHIWAPGNAKDAPTGAIFHSTFNQKAKLFRVLRDVTLPLKASGDIFFTLSPDLIPFTALIAKIKGKKYVADLNENYLKLLNDRSWAKGLIGALAKIVAWSANNIASRADLLIVADAQVPPFKAKNRMVIKNLPDTKVIPDSGALSTNPRAIYIGDIRKSRGLYAMLQIAELAPNWNFDFIGSISPADQSYVDQWLKNSTAADRVKFHGRLAPDKSWEFAKGAWVGLTLLEPTPAFIEAVPSKLYEYAYSGLAILSTPLPRCVELINESGGGVIAKDATSAAAVLNSWVNNQDAINGIRTNAKRWAHETLQSEVQYATFLAAVESL